MLRRLSALLAMVVIIAMAVLLLWRVYLHHQNLRGPEPDVVLLNARAA